ncbi:Two-component response regulator-like protein [Morus notabilis]|uniref:Two-component response regulator-like protein n=1 Tax=Morus notabilis TaxID=981085 RepID=W9RR27_9ROSA|nr:Two-component response regulator-like protein [Morus notabilis]
MTPFKALYGRDPPKLLRFELGSTANSLLEQQLQSRDAIMDELHAHLLKAQQSMKMQADLKRRDVSFEVADLVFLKLRPYHHRSLAKFVNEKLSPRLYGPYQVLARVGSVAYRLHLPTSAKIHPVFHVSNSRKLLASRSLHRMFLPCLTVDMELRVEPECLLAIQFSPVTGQLEVFILAEVEPVFYFIKDVPNGKQAWKVLEDITTDVDLVLTEVATPCLSGIGLLCKIMSNKTFKDIPVIMMSSHDSRSMVLKCLSKGAVDFLVKPIRKNELKNLWQHVWRKYHISSGSGSESGIWIEKPIKSRTVEDSDNNNGSNDEDDTESIGLDFRGESDSGTQSSWTRAVDFESPRAMPQRDWLTDPPDSTCTQAIHPREEPFVNNWLPESATRTPVGQDDELGRHLFMQCLHSVLLFSPF